MILRHKSRQISFLHWYHHSSMLLLSDLARTYYPWPSIGVFLAMNSFVHILLYLYYGLAAVNPENPPSWKKLMTQVYSFFYFLHYFFYCITNCMFLYSFLMPVFPLSRKRSSLPVNCIEGYQTRVKQLDGLIGW